MPEQKPHRQIIEDTEHIRIYHSRVLLGGKKLPIITKNKTDVDHWLLIQEQERIQRSVRETYSIARSIAVETGVQEPQGEPVNTVVEAIMEIPGVSYAVPAGYQIVVIKGVAFSWEEIEPKISGILKAFSFDDLESIQFTDGAPKPEVPEPTVESMTDEEKEALRADIAANTGKK